MAVVSTAARESCALHDSQKSPPQKEKTLLLLEYFVVEFGKHYQWETTGKLRARLKRK